MKYTLSVLVENHAGVLSKVSGLFSRRGFNIDSLAVGITEDSNFSRITIVADGDEYVIEQLADIPVEIDLASEFRYRDPIVDDKTLTIVISQSGETADTK